MRRNFNNYWIGSGVFVAALASIGVGYLMQAQEQSADASRQSNTQGDTKAGSDFSLGPGQVTSGLQPLNARGDVKSLFALARNGNLLIDESSESVLDSLLATLPSNPTAMQLKNLETAATIGLPDVAAAKAAALVRNYINYRKADSELPVPSDPENLVMEKDAFDKKAALRRRYFDRETVDGLFGVQEAQKLYTLEVMHAASDHSLGSAEKMERIKALHQALPPKVAARETNGANFSAELEEKVATLRLRNAPDEEVKQLRLQYFGAEEALPTREKQAGK